MDPSIWGPLAWQLIFDINWGVCLARNSSGGSGSNSTPRVDMVLVDAAVNSFYNSLQYLLPCKYCRESYREYLKSMGSVNTMDQNDCTAALKWAYNLKNKVNDKLGKRDRPTFDQVMRRMKTYQAFGSQYSVIDFLFIVVENYDGGDPEMQTQKRAWFFVMLRSLAMILSLVLQHHHPYSLLGQAMKTIQVTPACAESKATAVQYLCSIGKLVTDSKIPSLRNPFAGAFENPGAMCIKYSNAHKPTPDETNSTTTPLK